MTEWWTYRPSDFLMFAPRTYWRLFELHNDAWWPAQPLLLLAAAAWIAWLSRGGPTALRVGVAGLAAAWAFVAASFLEARFAPINWVASAYAMAFGVQAAGLAVLASRGDAGATGSRRRRVAALALAAWAVAAHPLLAVVSGRPWAQAEVIGLAPDPTVIATLGALAWADARTRATRWLLTALRTVATAWCVVGSATLWTMGAAQGWVMAVAAIVAWGAMLGPGHADAPRGD